MPKKLGSKEVELKPYKNLQTHHLGLLLLLARGMFVVGGLLLPVVILLIVGVLLGGPHNPDTKIVIATFMRVLPLMLILFIASGVFAAVVAFEESYRKRTEAIINNTQA